MADERIHVLRDILLELHNGASPEVGSGAL